MAFEKSQFNSDTPREATPSSVGALVWPPVEANENRTRGMNPEVLTSASALNDIIGQFRRLPLTDKITRNSGRIYATHEALNGLINEQGLEIDPFIEAIVPLKNCGVEPLEDVNLIYLGNNAPSRLLSDREMGSEIEMARNIFSLEEPPKFYSHEGVEFKVIDQDVRNDSEIQRQIADLYSAFSWTEKDVAKILSNENNLIVGAFNNDGLLISTGMAERAAIPLTRDGKTFDFVMYEITEAATREGYRNNGYYLAVALIINRLLTETDVNLVYGESNLSSPGVIKAAYRQARHSALDNLANLGLDLKPLRQPVRISGGVNDKRADHLKNDLLVTYTTRSELIQKHGKPNS